MNKIKNRLFTLIAFAGMVYTQVEAYGIAQKHTPLPYAIDVCVSFYFAMWFANLCRGKK